MGDVKVIFQGTKKTLTHEKELEVFCNPHNEISIKLSNKITGTFDIINLNKFASVRLVRELKKEIGLIESEVSNG